jgi:hypothetical protein
MLDERARFRTISERAYAIWEQEGRPDGKALDHWVQAEAEIGSEKIIGITNYGKIVTSYGRAVTARDVSRSERW